jgi:hypothetical protein
MPLTDLQRRVCRLLADRRIASGEQYVAGGLALNESLGGQRLSRDIDLFHDTDTALASSSETDQRALAAARFVIVPGRRSVGFVEVTVSDGRDRVEVQWVRESAYRFFPLVVHPDLGLMLHPFDLATNKVLALVSRVAVRDWIDILTCHERLSPLGCLFWAASGKDPGLGPLFILEEAARTAHYSAMEFDAMAFEGQRPDRATLTRSWRAALDEARAIVDRLPPEEVGGAVLDEHGTPFRGSVDDLDRALAGGRIVFHRGAIRGALPVVRPLS